ncbi:MAG: hypothetical protein AAGG44_19825 [Planctomycetota bacterium]
MAKQKRTPLPDWALDSLRCPCTKEPLEYAPAELIGELAALQSAGKLSTAIGILIEHQVEAGLVNHSRTRFHLIRDGIPTLVPREAIQLPVSRESP